MMEEWIMSEIEAFKKDIELFEPINVQQLEQKLTETKKQILFLGRATCPFCRKFAPKLKAVKIKLNLPVYFVDSENSDDLEKLTALRNQYTIPTVPALLVVQEEKVKVVCDSSLTEEEITQFIQNR